MPAPAQITSVYRSHLLATRATVIRDILRVWPAFDPTDIAGSWPAVETALTRIVQVHSVTAAELAVVYYNALRFTANPATPFTATVAPPPPVEQITASLQFTGARRAGLAVARSAPDKVINESALVGVTGSSTRLVLDASRDTVQHNIQRDSHARGWQRVTDGNACEFCTMLEERGAVYKSDTVDFEAHDHCSCSSEPVFN